MELTGPQSGGRRDCYCIIASLASAGRRWSAVEPEDGDGRNHFAVSINDPIVVNWLRGTSARAGTIFLSQ